MDLDFALITMLNHLSDTKFNELFTTHEMAVKRTLFALFLKSSFLHQPDEIFELGHHKQNHAQNIETVKDVLQHGELLSAEDETILRNSEQIIGVSFRCDTKRLSTDVVQHIFSFLSIRDRLAKASVINHDWFDILSGMKLNEVIIDENSAMHPISSLYVEATKAVVIFPQPPSQMDTEGVAKSREIGKEIFRRLAELRQLRKLAFQNLDATVHLPVKGSIPCSVFPGLLNLQTVHIQLAERTKLLGKRLFDDFGQWPRMIQTLKFGFDRRPSDSMNHRILEHLLRAFPNIERLELDDYLSPDLLSLVSSFDKLKEISLDQQGKDFTNSENLRAFRTGYPGGTLEGKGDRVLPVDVLQICWWYFEMIPTLVKFEYVGDDVPQTVLTRDDIAGA